MGKLLLILLPVVLIVASGFYLHKGDEVVNYLNTPTTLTFNNNQYKLVWSSHPVSNYYKQEYIPADETPDHYQNMILMDYLLIDTPAINIIGVKVNEIVARKKTDVVANYQLLHNKEKGEYILDFLLSAGNPEHLDVVEWNGYHYNNYTDKAGHKGVLLFGVSERAYGKVIWPYMQNLKTHKTDVLQQMSKYEIPPVEVK